MKINHECIRDVMIFLESYDYYTLDSDGQVVPKQIFIHNIFTALPQYSEPDIFYSIFNLSQAGYLNISSDIKQYGIKCAVNYITFNGHEFLEKIKSDNNWSKVKKGLNFLQDYSLSAISAVASGITEGAVATYLSSIK